MRAQAFHGRCVRIGDIVRRAARAEGAFDAAHRDEVLDRDREPVQQAEVLALHHCLFRVLCSVAGDLKLSEVVDAPNWIVSMHFPLALLPE